MSLRLLRGVLAVNFVQPNGHRSTAVCRFAFKAAAAGPIA